jgi:hypothetical protein
MEISDVISQKEIQNSTIGGKLLTLFRDAQGPILEHYQEKGKAVNSVRCSEILQDQLEPDI